MEINKQPIYPVEPWTVTETEFKMETNYRNETTFSLSNGYLGTRGTLEEGYPFTADEGLEGNFINGFYESEPIRYGEWNYGFPTESQSLLNLPNLKTIRIFLEGGRCPAGAERFIWIGERSPGPSTGLLRRAGPFMWKQHGW